MFPLKLLHHLQSYFTRAVTRQSIAHLDARLLKDVGLNPDASQRLPQESDTPNNLTIRALHVVEDSTQHTAAPVVQKR
ncbi:hypothetical protein LH51_13335 [Nitrincola sp. A-D6]|uniref:DUF1127 domain-containing protein n=1 Tax=Nitrincola sp. A-D6 TaxID=1545442 RepID=UPI00051FCD8A|nr:DUF1127 domain-containing protein [Nitrincola sp. A-D6]KGK41606.1 hypothetical protein LH51_13335 [Nitrincola sp. A-D6]